MNDTHPDNGATHDAVGRSRTKTERLVVARAQALAATLDLDPEALRPGDSLPFGWHWIYFNDTPRRAELGEDGHERRGAFLPSIDLPRRMWAGGRLRFLEAAALDAMVQRTSTVRALEHKVGRSGALAFVTVEHRIHREGRTLVEERQDLVYLGHRDTAKPPAANPTPGEPRWSETRTLDEVTLFRFSALTFNGHRIHYDHPYATEVEGYPGLVVHGPLLALLLLDAGLRHDAGPVDVLRMPVTFEYRARQPIFCGESFALEGIGSPEASGHGVDTIGTFDLRATTRAQGTAMTASLTLG